MLSPLDTASVLISTTDAPHLEATELTSDLDAFEEAFPVTWLMVTPDEDWFAKYPPVQLRQSIRVFVLSVCFAGFDY